MYLARYVIVIQKPIVFLYTVSEKSENEIKKQVHLTDTIEKNKILKTIFNQGSTIFVN